MMPFLSSSEGTEACTRELPLPVRVPSLDCQEPRKLERVPDQEEPMPQFVRGGYGCLRTFVIDSPTRGTCPSAPDECPFSLRDPPPTPGIGH